MCSNSHQASGGMPVCKGNVQGECPKQQTLWMWTDCGSEIVVLLQTRICGQDPQTDVDGLHHSRRYGCCLLWVRSVKPQLGGLWSYGTRSYITVLSSKPCTSVFCSPNYRWQRRLSWFSHDDIILTVLLNVCACSVHMTRCKASVWSICLSRLMTSELYCSRKSYIVLVNADTWTAYVSALLSEGQYTCFIMTMTWTMFRVHTRQWPSRKGISRKQNLFLASGMLFQPSWSCRALTSGK